MTERVDLAVVGGGISGLAAAWEGVRRGARVLVLEAADAPGGTLRTTPFAGVELDEAADAFLARVPEAIELCDELGLADDLVSPSTGAAYVWSEGALRRLPAEQLLGVPTDLDAVAASGILSAAGLARARADLSQPGDRPTGDESIGALVRRRLGDEVLDRLVAPLLGGIWAGDCDELSLAVAAPNLLAARDRNASLVRGAAAVRAEAARGETARAQAGRAEAERGQAERGQSVSAATAGTTGEPPVFLAPRGGMGRLVGALADRLGDSVRCGNRVVALERVGAAWRITLADEGNAGAAAHGAPADGARRRTGSGASLDDGPSRVSDRTVAADRVVLATPAFAAGPLLADTAPEAAAFLAGIDYASVVLVTLAVLRAGIDHPLDGSGFLVPQSAGRLLTACSWVTSKWGHLGIGPEIAVLRASAGRAGDDRAASLADDELVARLLADLRDTMDLHAAPVDVRVSRWERSFPQPRPGHLDTVCVAEEALARAAPGVAITGAWSRGVGIPACIRGARSAATRLLDDVAAAGE